MLGKKAKNKEEVCSEAFDALMTGIKHAGEIRRQLPDGEYKSGYYAALKDILNQETKDRIVGALESGIPEPTGIKAIDNISEAISRLIIPGIDKAWDDALKDE